MEKEALKKMAFIEDEMHLSRQKSRTDSEFYKDSKLADSNRLLFTPQFLQLKMYEAIAQNTKVYFGDNIPNMFMESNPLNNKQSKLGSKKEVDLDATDHINNQKHNL